MRSLSVLPYAKYGAIFAEGYDTGLLGVRDFRISVISN